MALNNRPSEQTQQDALQIARATQKPGQTKEQTKLIAQGIEKGIALYKKQQKEKARQADKAKKKALRAKRNEVVSETDTTLDEIPATGTAVSSSKLPWVLLLLSWAGFIGYWLMAHYA